VVYSRIKIPDYIPNVQKYMFKDVKLKKLCNMYDFKLVEEQEIHSKPFKICKKTIYRKPYNLVTLYRTLK